MRTSCIANSVIGASLSVALGVLLPGLALSDSPRVFFPANGNSYQRFDQSLSWHDAKAACEEKGAHLVTLTSAEENAFVFDTFVYAPDHLAFYIWLGATDEESEGNWRWITGEPWGFTAWYPREPNNSGGEDYAEMARHRIYAERSWNDFRSTEGGACANAYSCSDINAVSWVCEWEGSETVTYLAVAAMPDINGNGSAELAALLTYTDGSTFVRIKDSETKEYIKQIEYPAEGREPLGLVSIANSTGHPGIALLLKKSNGQGIVQIRDAVTGQWIHQMPFFGEEWEVLSIAAEDSDKNGVSEISVLGETDDGMRAAISIKDADTREPVNWIELPMME